MTDECGKQLRDVYQLGVTTSGTPFHRNVWLALR
jgi:hypothetical protein